MQKVHLYPVRIRRDAHTTINETVTAHEIPVLQAIFGIENVHNASGKRIDQEGRDKPVGERIIEDEYDRLYRKYGATVIEKVFGIYTSNTLASRIEVIKEEDSADKAGTSLSRKTKNELMAIAQEKGIAVTESMTNKEIILLIESADKE